MNGRRRRTREESRKQALDSAWSMEMSKLTRDGTAEPVSRGQILRRERRQRIFHFPRSAADHEQDWQPCPVVRPIHTKLVLHTHTAVVIHIYAYTAVNRARMYMSPNKKYTGTWYINQYKQQYCTSTYIYMYLPRIQLTTSRFGNLTRLIHIFYLLGCFPAGAGSSPEEVKRG